MYTFASSLPGTLLSPLAEVLSEVHSTSIATLKNIPKSTDNMAPGSPFIKAISSLPVVPGIIAHSIIPVKNPDDPKEKWNDGVVEYKSAHLDGGTEVRVSSGHSCQDNPNTIEEVRRIVLEHLAE